METNRNNEVNASTNSHEIHIDIITQNKIHKHLTDINDTISAQDILNINTNISSSGVPKVGKNQRDELSTEKIDEVDNDNNKEQVPTTWNVLD